MRRWFNVLWWNGLEFLLYLILGLIIPIVILYITNTDFSKLWDSNYQNIFTVSTVLFSVFIVVGITRFFDRLKEFDRLISTLKVILSSVRIWTKGIETLTQKWDGQLNWLNGQLSRSNHTGHILMSHKFQNIEMSFILELPDKFGPISLFKLKQSLISINHKVEANLNFMVEKIHLRENLTTQEINEIKGLLNGNPTSILPVLRKELPEVECELRTILLKLGENDV